MGKLSGEKVTIGQADGPDIDLVVHGDELYARYETPDGYPVIYDERCGLFCYALLRGGRFISSSVPASESPPPGARRHAAETDAIRQEKAEAKAAARRPPPDERKRGARS